MGFLRAALASASSGACADATASGGDYPMVCSCGPNIAFAVTGIVAGILSEGSARPGAGHGGQMSLTLSHPPPQGLAWQHESPGGILVRTRQNGPCHLLKSLPILTDHRVEDDVIDK